MRTFEARLAAGLALLVLVGSLGAGRARLVLPVEQEVAAITWHCNKNRAVRTQRNTQWGTHTFHTHAHTDCTAKTCSAFGHTSSAQ